MTVTRRMTFFRSLGSALRIATRPGSPGIAERLSALPRLVRAVRTGEYHGTSLGRLALLAAAVGYVVSPVDFMPEGLLMVFGLADDAVVISWIAATVVHETESFLAWERVHRTAGSSGYPGTRDPQQAYPQDDPNYRPDYSESYPHGYSQAYPQDSQDYRRGGPGPVRETLRGDTVD